MFTIGRLGEIIGISVRTIRHYHQIGLLPEPARDQHSHRRYGAADLVLLLRIRRLVEIGFALKEIGELLEAPPEVLQTALAELDADLAAQQAEIAARRKALARLNELEHDPQMPDELARWQPTLQSWGISQAMIRSERDTMLLATAIMGNRSTDHTEERQADGEKQPDTERSLFDEIYDRLFGQDGGAAARLLYQEIDAIRDLPADHPRVDALIESTTAFLKDHATILRRVQDHDLLADPSIPDAVATTLFEDMIDDMPPAIRRLIRVQQRLYAELIEQTD
ncbi:MerR family transcriptional regulator [Actinoalloteichus hymeniacidonis]|uniref:Transcriptional regulator n=1 Tax=Actinoalloteichus hymeniacidonis TaxID=340345 RepID=A0AAC9HV20_9PSEU|nr:MerR family transcriptional regulator [Actinoalloteichus hymeniacidonis]AOS65988.1 putative transcriptional regulator [Actinoalloteichus hymeniacidonis]MBB5905910.1 DNA-binding transcriptional MerR regulator [Actinoalloteichus hymeniacidonis]